LPCSRVFESVVYKKVLALLIFVILVLGSCSNGNDIVGAWTDIEGSTWVFSSDGKLTYTEPNGRVKENRYSIFDGERRAELTIFDVEYSAIVAMLTKDQKYSVEYSKDGKTLRLTNGKDFYGWDVAGPGWSTNQLTKKTGTTVKKTSVKSGGGDSKLVGVWEGDWYSFEFLKDGTFTNDDGESGIWTAKNNRITITVYYGETVDYELLSGDYKLSGKTLTLTDKDGRTMVFTKK
jgi:hypothetical protein